VTDLIALTADLHNWGESVRLGVQPNGRYAANEFSGAKILSWGQNLTWAERAHAAGLDEVVLLNEHGFVSECTSANIFATFGSELVTPPLSDGCLPGVTREILLETGRIGRFRIAERRLRVEDLYAADGVFITSSTRNLLPAAEICGRPLRMDHETADLLSEDFENYVRSYTAERLRVLSRE
jgi:branched-chain amino acid aminotransferase